MTKIIQNLLGGLAGATALNILHQGLAHHVQDAPRVDLVGEEALTKTAAAVGIDPPEGRELFNTTLAADIISNAMYFSIAGNGSDKNLVARGAVCGLVAGVGALTLTKPLGLNDRPINKSAKTKYMTVAYYAFGGLVAGVTIKMLRGKKL